MPEQQLLLYELPGCPFCQKVKRKLADLGLEYETRRVPSAHAERETVKAISGQTEVPVLVDQAHGIEGLHESDAIIAYLEETYGSA